MGCSNEETLAIWRQVDEAPDDDVRVRQFAPSLFGLITRNNINMLNVQRFITADGWEALTTKLGIKVTAYPDNGVAVLNYTPKSPKTHPVVVECRALILSYPGAEVVARSFDRFFNRNEDGVDEEAFDFRDSWCMCKYDGTLILFYFCTQTDRWEIATRTRAFAEGPFGASNLGETFRLKILQASFPGVYQQNKVNSVKLHRIYGQWLTFSIG